MKKLSLAGATLVVAAMLSTAPVSLHWSQGSGMTVAQDDAQARIGRPATPGSVAGVARRSTRRAVRHCAAGVCY